MLTDFRAWMREAAEKGTLPESSPARAEPIDLHTLLAQFAALRHEVNLQTRAVRAQQEQNTQTLEVLQQSLDALQQSTRGSPADNGQGSDDLVRGQLKTLIELYDALALAAREVQRVRERILPRVDELSMEGASSPAELEPTARSGPSRLSFLARLFGQASANSAVIAAQHETIAFLRQTLAAERRRHQEARETAEGVRRLLDSVVTGYTMSVQRLERALHQHDLEPIPCVGEPFDPEQMEVLEVVSDGSRPSGEVIDEVRRGYRWRGRVFRHAQVRVAKSV
jgi:molecular chaperone GrpE